MLTAPLWQPPSDWAAERVLASEYSDEFDWRARLRPTDTRPIFFTGEHVYSWMFDGDYKELAPLKPTAELLAAREWPALYDLDVLRNTPVPLAAAVYYQVGPCRLQPLLVAELATKWLRARLAGPVRADRVQ